MKRLLFSFLVIWVSIFAANHVEAQGIQNEAFAKKLSVLLSHTVATIDVHQAHHSADEYLWLDIRERDEYDISYIAPAKFMGYDHPDWHLLDSVPKDTKIIVYCSVGYRSEKIGEKLKARGFKNVFNLYGSIFEWANCGFPLTDAQGAVTNQIHTYNKDWSRWINNPAIIKQW